MQLYYHPLSPNCRRALMTARHLSLPVEETVVDVLKGEHKTPDYLAINPNGQVPALVDGDFKLWESRSIMQYVATKKPEARLLGESEREWADLARWLFWDACNLSRHMGTIAFEKIFKELTQSGKPDAAVIAAATASLKRFLGVLDGGLKGNDYLVGGRLTVADICLGCTFTYAEHLKLSLEGHTNVTAWLARITALPAWAATKPPL